MAGAGVDAEPAHRQLHQGRNPGRVATPLMTPEIRSSEVGAHRHGRMVTHHRGGALIPVEDDQRQAQGVTPVGQWQDRCIRKGFATGDTVPLVVSDHDGVAPVRPLGQAERMVVGSCGFQVVSLGLPLVGQEFDHGGQMVGVAQRVQSLGFGERFGEAVGDDAIVVPVRGLAGVKGAATEAGKE